MKLRKLNRSDYRHQKRFHYARTHSNTPLHNTGKWFTVDDIAELPDTWLKHVAEYALITGEDVNAVVVMGTCRHELSSYDVNP